MAHTILIKYAEIALKGRNRRYFEQQLIDNIKMVVAEKSVTVTREYGRINVSAEQESDVRRVANKLSYVFGVHSFALVDVAERSEESIVEMALQKVSRALTTEGAVASFAVDTRRSDKRFPKNSQQINERVGKEIREKHGDLRVDLGNPDLTVYVEIREKGIYVYTDRDEVFGPGGLPVGVTGKGLTLFSGGIDSPVATWSMMKRGLVMDAVYFHSPPYTGEKTKEKVFDLTRVLSKWQGRPVTVFVPSFGEIQKHIAENAPEGYWTVLFRRSMHRIAEAIAQDEGHVILSTGDSLAQVASQTPENLTVIDAASDMLTVRPLITNDKRETIDLAHKIGTYDISIRPYEDCCTVFTPDTPRTKARLSSVEEAEGRCADLSTLEQHARERTVAYTVYERTIKER